MASNNQEKSNGKQEINPLDVIHYCKQCGKDMGFEWFLGPVCKKCCRKNHKRVTGGK